MVTSLISAVRGTLEAVGPGWIDVAVGGVTFRVSIPASMVEDVGRPGDQVRLFTSLQVREESLHLYGFLTEEARSAFETLLQVNGIGPRVALNVLSRLTPDALAAAVSTGDADAFAGIPGVGKKTASRIVLEMKGKLKADWAVAVAADGDGEVVDALTALGYSPSEVREALSSVPRGGGLTTEDRVRLALQHMAGR